MEKSVVDFSKLSEEVLFEYEIEAYDSYEQVFNELYLDDFSVYDVAQLLKNQTMQELIESEPYLYKFSNKYYRWTVADEYMNELAEKYPEAVISNSNFEPLFVNEEQTSKNVFVGNYNEVKAQILEAYHSDDVELAQLLAGIGTNLSMADMFKLYAELRHEIDGDITMYFQSSGEAYDVGVNDRIELDKLREHLSDFIPAPTPTEALREYLLNTVSFRMLSLSKSDVSDEEISLLVDSVIRHPDVVFDYDKLDDFLAKEYAKLHDIDSKTINELQGIVHNLRHELDGVLGIDTEKAPKIEKILTITELQLEAAKLNVDMDLSPSAIIDSEHLDCFWYGGTIGSLEYKGYEVYIKVCGDVNISVLSEDGTEVLFDYKNKNNTGVCKDDEVYQFIDNDLELHTLAQEGRIVWENNNWVECVVFAPSGEAIDLPMMDSILDDNILEAFADVSWYVEKINEYERNLNPALFIVDDEIMIGDDRQSVNAYLWAVDSLVARIPEPEHIENVNFYVDYHFRNDEVKLIASYDTPVDDGELNKVLEIPLSDTEKAELIRALDAYCKKTYSQSCLEFVNDIRSEEGLTKIERSVCRSLIEQINSAVETQTAVAMDGSVVDKEYSR